MATQQIDAYLYRRERFTRLVAAQAAAQRHELWRSSDLFWQKLLNMGAYINNQGFWQLDDPPAAGSSQPY